MAACLLPHYLEERSHRIVRIGQLSSSRRIVQRGVVRLGADCTVCLMLKSG